MRAFNLAASSPWAIVPEALETILSIAARENETPEAVAAMLGRPLDNTRTVSMRDGVAVIPVQGPIFRYANLFTEISGAVSVEILALDFASALENPRVKGIVLDIGSPGGGATGINELAKMIADAADRKPVIAYGGGMVASGAYWLASAAREIVADETAMLGSIGVVVTARKRDADDTRIQIVSSQSPRKRVDPGTEDGRTEIQRLVDDLAAVFVGSVAANRNVTEETVLKDFGEGGLLIAERAIEAGMADRTGSLESVIAELREAADSHARRRTAESKKGATQMSEVAKPGAEATGKTGDTPAQTAPTPVPTAPVVDASAIAANARKAERERVASIMGCAEAKGLDSLAHHLATRTDLSVEEATAILASAPRQAEQRTNPLQAAMDGVKNPQVGAAADVETSNKDETLRFIQNEMKRGRKHNMTRNSVRLHFTRPASGRERGSAAQQEGDGSGRAEPGARRGTGKGDLGSRHGGGRPGQYRRRHAHNGRQHAASGRRAGWRVYGGLHQGRDRRRYVPRQRPTR